MFSFFSVSASHQGHYITSNPHTSLSISWLRHCSRIFLFSVTGQEFCRTSLYWNLPEDFFSWCNWDYGFGEEGDRGKMPFTSHHVKAHAINLTGHCRYSPGSPGVGDICQVLHHRIILLFLPLPFPHSIFPSSFFTPPPFHSILSAGVIMHSPHWRGWELSFTSWGQIIYIHYVGLLLMGDSIFSPHLSIYSNIYLCQYGLINIYITLWAIM